MSLRERRMRKRHRATAAALVEQGILTADEVAVLWGCCRAGMKTPQWLIDNVRKRCASNGQSQDGDAS